MYQRTETDTESYLHLFANWKLLVMGAPRKSEYVPIESAKALRPFRQSPGPFLEDFDGPPADQDGWLEGCRKAKAALSAPTVEGEHRG